MINFLKKDVYTSTLPGKDPVFNVVKSHDIVLNEQFRSYLRSESLEVVIFDDSQPLTQGQPSKLSLIDDMIGKARLKLSSLLDNQIIDTILPIVNSKGGRVGQIQIKAYWYDTSIDQSQNAGQNNNLLNVKCKIINLNCKF